MKLLAIDMPDKTFANFLEPLEAAMEHEKYVTSLINDIYAAALEAHDYRAQKFLGWFIDEQLEEEDNADTMITNMKLFGGDPKGLYDLDQACAARVYTVPSPLAGKGRRACHPLERILLLLAGHRALGADSYFEPLKGWNPSCSTRTRTSTLPRNTRAGWPPCANGPRALIWRSWKAPTTPARLGRPLPAA